MPDTRPLVTFIIISYNQERFIAEAVESALAQTYSPLEVVISDDCSTDATFDLIEKITAGYTGPHKIIAHRNQNNLGLAGNVNKAWDLSSGALAVFQGGDDISLPHRTATLVAAWLSRDPRPDLVYSGVVLIDEAGKVISENTEVVDKTPPMRDTITGRNPFIAGGCAAAYSRQLHFFVGPLLDGIAEDFVYSFRALLGNGVVGIPEPLVLYRQHPTSMMAEFMQTHMNGRLSSKELVAYITKLIEHKKAMDAYGVKSPYLRWRLDRRIKSFKTELGYASLGMVKKWLFAFWALTTLRIRLLAYMLSILIAPGTKNNLSR